MTGILLAALVGAIVATFVTLVIVYKADTDLHEQLNDLTEYLDALNIAQEEDSARANRLYQDLQHTKERVNADLVAYNQRLKLHQTGQVQLEKRLHNLEFLKADGDRLIELDPNSSLAKSIDRDISEVRDRYYPKENDQV
jgi:hypothetical protein